MLHKSVTLKCKCEKSSDLLCIMAGVIPLLVLAIGAASHAYTNHLNYQLQSEAQAMACHQIKAEDD